MLYTSLHMKGDTLTVMVVPLCVVVMWCVWGGRAGERGWWSGSGEQDPLHHFRLPPQMDQGDSSVA